MTHWTIACLLVTCTDCMRFRLSSKQVADPDLSPQTRDCASSGARVADHHQGHYHRFLDRHHSCSFTILSQPQEVLHSIFSTYQQAINYALKKASYSHQ